MTSEAAPRRYAMRLDFTAADDAQADPAQLGISPGEDYDAILRVVNP